VQNEDETPVLIAPFIVDKTLGTEVNAFPQKRSRTESTNK